MRRVTGILSIGIALVAAVAVQAQDRVMSADVPFMFYAGPNMMPQGAYRVDQSSSGNIAWFRSPQKGATAALLTLGITAKKPVEPAKLVFHRYGEDYFLAEIWTGNATAGRMLPPSRHEKELARSGMRPTLAVVKLVLH